MGLLNDLTPLAVAACLATCIACASAQEPGTPKNHSETITSADHEYTIEMGGTMDGPATREPIGYGYWRQNYEPMRTVRMANVGDTPVVNPWVFTNDRGHWRTCKEMTDWVGAPYEDEVERAVALWWWETRHRFHTYTGDAENTDAVKVWNVYGHTLCGNDAQVMADVWRTAGFEIHYPRIQGHAISEVYAGGRWNLIDGDENILTLLRDNETGANEADIRRDHDLIKRTHCYGILGSDSRRVDEFSASLYVHEDQPKQKQGLRTRLGHEMKFTLRPGEALVWGWENRLKAHGQDETMREGKKPLANGWWEYAPRLTEARIAADAESAEGIVAGADGVRGEGALVYRVRAPYVMVGGSVEVDGEALGLDLSWDGEEWIELAGEDIDEHFPLEGPARYTYLLRVRVAAGGALRSLRIANDLQMAPLCMPYLELGENRVQYTDETEGARQVELTHEWVERSDNQPPSTPPRPIFPANGARLDHTQVRFEWPAATDPDGDAIADYQFQLSRYEDMRWPMSPNFFKLLSRTAEKGTEHFTLPYRGLLNPETTYYWQVRARDAQGLWGAWSEVWSFQPGGPGVPTNLAMRVDEEARTVMISWRDNPVGEKPVAYKVYGSNERGFTVSDVEYEVWMGNQENQVSGWVPTPANLMETTAARSIQVVGAGLDAANANRGYYRVVAVDANGIESGPSDYVEMPRPLICTAAAIEGKVGEPLAASVGTIWSMQDLACRTLDDPQKIYNAAFWEVEHPVYALAGGPDWLTIDAESGALTGTPPDAGEFAATVTASIEGVGEDAMEITVRVAP